MSPATKQELEAILQEHGLSLIMIDQIIDRQDLTTLPRDFCLVIPKAFKKRLSTVELIQFCDRIARAGFRTNVSDDLERLTGCLCAFVHQVEQTSFAA